jgi:hypothetical protein
VESILVVRATIVLLLNFVINLKRGRNGGR